MMIKKGLFIAAFVAGMISCNSPAQPEQHELTGTRWANSLCEIFFVNEHRYTLWCYGWNRDSINFVPEHFEYTINADTLYVGDSSAGNIYWRVN